MILIGRKKVILSGLEIVKNSLLGTIYEKCNILAYDIQEIFSESIELGKRIKVVKLGCVILCKQEYEYKILKINIKSDKNYCKDKVCGYVDKIELLDNKGDVIEDLDGYGASFIIDKSKIRIIEEEFD